MQPPGQRDFSLLRHGHRQSAAEVVQRWGPERPGNACASREFCWAGERTERCSEPVVFASAVLFVSEWKAARGRGSGRALEAP